MTNCLGAPRNELSLGVQRNDPLLLDPLAVRPEIPLGLETPAVVRARPVHEMVKIDGERLIDLRGEAQGEQLGPHLQCVFRACVVLLRQPLDHFVQPNLLVVHDDSQNVVAVVNRLLLVVRKHILRGISDPNNS